MNLGVSAKASVGPFRHLLVSAAIAAVARTAVAVVRGELLSREGDPAEHFAGILGAAAAGLAAFLHRNGVVQHRDHQLGVPLQPDNGELSQGDEQPPLAAGEHQLLVKGGPDGLRNLNGHRFAGAVADLLDLGAQHHGIQNLYC